VCRASAGGSPTAGVLSLLPTHARQQPRLAPQVTQRTLQHSPHTCYHIASELLVFHVS